MISVDQAEKFIAESVTPLSATRLSLLHATRMVLAEDICATTDIPPFPQSSMDGYAFSFQGRTNGQTLEIAGEVVAGADKPILFSPGTAVRIFTGAQLPEDADTVVMQEKTEVSNGRLTINDDHLIKGTNVRPRGTDIKAGYVALPAGSTLTPASIGFLAGVGVTQVSVYRKPTISLIITGKELQQPGQPLNYGQVYESNSVMLVTALGQVGFSDIECHWVDDNLGALEQQLMLAITASDVVLLTGGISVGDYDFVLEAATKCGIEKIFHKIKQRPGKPLYFGKKDNKLIFGLPGNPSSVLTCFYEYVLPALQKLTSAPGAGLQRVKARLAKPFEKPAGLTHFLKGYYDGETVIPLHAQESYRLSSFARANCLIKIEEAVTSCSIGSEVEIHLLPN